MSNKNLLWVMFLGAVFLSSTPVLAMQSESPVACDEAAEPLYLVYGDHTTGCEINGPTDLDGFNFDGVAGDVIRITVRADGRLDGRVELYDPSGGLVTDTNCQSSTGGCSLQINETLGITGRYGIAVSDHGVNDTGTYTLQLESNPPIVNNPIDYNVPVDDSIDPVTDTDFFAFNAFAGNVVRVIVRANGRLDGRLEIYDPSGALVIDTECQSSTGGCTVLTDQALTMDGTYQLAVSDHGANDSGSYQVNIQCIVGLCPLPPTPPVCNLELSQDVYVDGETVTADVFRIANPGAAPLAVEMKVWMNAPGSGQGSFINVGADGSLVLPAGADFDLGPQPLLPVSSIIPRGTLEFGCRLLNPITGRLLREDRNFFEVQ